MSTPRVDEFAWDPENIEKVHAHGLRPDDIDDALDSGPAFFRNRRDRRGMYQLVGRDRSGRYITVVIEPSARGRGVWRPITAWFSKQGEITKARKQGV
jgi:hypothetical protein